MSIRTGDPTASRGLDTRLTVRAARTAKTNHVWTDGTQSPKRCVKCSQFESVCTEFGIPCYPDRKAEFAAFRHVSPSAVTHCVLVGRKIKHTALLNITRTFDVYSAGWFWEDEDGSAQYTVGLALHNGESFRIEQTTTTEDFARTF